MALMQRFAALNHQIIKECILDALKLHEADFFTTIHNYIDMEHMILRKGAVSAREGERLLIPLNMRDGALICTGLGNDDWNQSAPHGAGRLFSRTQAENSFTLSEFKKSMAVNSVNALTGKKYHSTAESYYVQVRGTSDRLCREHGMSVIEEPGRHGKHYALWRANKLDYPTIREMLDADAEEVLSIAMSAGDVYRMMEERGYEVEHKSKYPTFKLKGSEHGFRLKRNGKSLSEDDITALIDGELMDTSDSFVIKWKEYEPLPKMKALSGFQKTILSWMYVLGILGRGKRAYYKANPEDVKSFRRLAKELEFLGRYDINGYDSLNEKEQAIDSEMDRLTKTRIILNSKKKRKKKLYDALADAEYYRGVPEDYAEEHARYTEAMCLLEGKDIAELTREKTEVYDELVSVNKALRELRSEKKVISNIRKDILHIEEALSDPEAARQENMRRLIEEER